MALLCSVVMPVFKAEYARFVACVHEDSFPFFSLSNMLDFRFAKKG